MKLPDKWIERLILRPEYGMGYQLVDVYFTDGTVARECFVFNCTELQLPETGYEGKTIDSLVNIYRE